MKLQLSILASASTLCVVAFAPSPLSNTCTTTLYMSTDDIDVRNVSKSRRDLLRASPFVMASILCGAESAEAIPEQKVYSSNAKNFMRLGEGDASGGSLYDNNPASPKARARRAMVGCKNTSARSLAGESIGNTKLSEKDCNQLVMKGESDFMLQALTELDCPSCPYGIGER